MIVLNGVGFRRNYPVLVKRERNVYLVLSDGYSLAVCENYSASVVHYGQFEEIVVRKVRYDGAGFAVIPPCPNKSDSSEIDGIIEEFVVYLVTAKLCHTRIIYHFLQSVNRKCIFLYLSRNIKKRRKRHKEIILTIGINRI